MSSIVSDDMSPKNDFIASEQINNSEKRNVEAELNDFNPDNVSSVILSNEKLESTSTVLETNEKQETSTVDPSLVTPVKSVETVDEVRSWIKKTLSGTGFKRKPYAGATSVPIVDEDEGLVRRKSWSFRITPDGTPNKGRSRSNSRTNSIRLSASKDKEDNHHTTEPDLIAAAETKNSISSYVVSTDDIPDLDEEQNNTLQPEQGENTPFNGNKDTGADSNNNSSNSNNDNTSENTNHDSNSTSKELFEEIEESRVVVDEVVSVVPVVVSLVENLGNNNKTYENKKNDEKQQQSEEHSNAVDTSTAPPVTAITTPVKSTEPEGSLTLSLPSSHTTPAPPSSDSTTTSTNTNSAAFITTTTITNNNTTINTANTPVVNTPVTATENRPISVSLKRTVVTSPTPVVVAKPVESYDRTKLRSVAELKKQESLALEKESSGRNNAVEKDPVVIKAPPAPVPVVEEKKEVVVEFFEFEVLVERNLTKKFDGLVLGELERHLNDIDFKKHFGATKTEFYKQPAWKQKDKKKKLGLF